MRVLENGLVLKGVKREASGFALAIREALVFFKRVCSTPQRKGTRHAI